MTDPRDETMPQPKERPDDSDNTPMDRTQVLEKQGDATQVLMDGAVPASWRNAVDINSVLSSRFKLIQLIGEGGMSEVYKAIDLRRVEAGARDPYLAVKVLTVRFDDYFSSLSVMHHEASKLQTLTHPNIVRVIDWDRDGQTVFMTMEYLDGKSLKLSLPRTAAELKIPRDQALHIIGSMAAALDFAHRKQIVHGDLKPGNVILTHSGEVKVIDFGIARFLRRPNEDAPHAEDWQSSFSALTPHYASPEMHDGAEADPRDDIFALGCIAYELLVGEHPYARTPSNRARDKALPVPPSRKLRAHEYRALERALQFDRAKRTSSAQRFVEELSGTRQKSALMMAMWGAMGIGVLALVMWAVRSLMQPPVMAPGSVLEAGAVFRDCPTCPLMKVLHPGEFQQGTAEGAADALSFEQPIRSVTIGYPLAAGVNEVTVGEFSEFAREYQRERKGCATYDGEWRRNAEVNWRNALPQQNSSFPVTCVSWQDAADYAAWLSLRTGASYRLPSASEWEYLARAGGATLPWANASEACAHANAADTAAAERFPGWTAFSCSDNHAEAAPVGTFESNAFGLNDTLGNVFEWTQDCWRDDYRGAPVDGAAMLDGDCTQREARGGSWFTTPAFVRPAYRNRFDTEYRGSSLGFRLVREIKNAN